MKLEKNQLYKEIALQKVFELIAAGCCIQSPEQLHIRGSISCGKNVKFDLNVIIEGNVRLGNNVVVGANSILLNKNVSCSPCNKNICYNYENPLLCIHEITKSDVNYAIKSLHLDS